MACVYMLWVHKGAQAVARGS